MFINLLNDSENSLCLVSISSAETNVNICTLCDGGAVSVWKIVIICDLWVVLQMKALLHEQRLRCAARNNSTSVYKSVLGG